MAQPHQETNDNRTNSSRNLYSTVRKIASDTALKVGLVAGIGLGLAGLPGCATPRDAIQIASEISLMDSAKEFPSLPDKTQLLDETYFDELIKTNDSTNQIAKKTMYPGFNDRAEEIKQQIADGDESINLTTSGFTPYKPLSSRTLKFKVSVNTLDTQTEVLSSNLSKNPLPGETYEADITIKWDSDRTYEDAEKTEGLQPTLVIDYRKRDASNKGYLDRDVDVVLRRDVNIEGWDKNLATLIVRHLQGKQTNLSEIYGMIDPFAQNHIKALQETMTVDRLRGILNGRNATKTEVVEEDDESFGTGNSYDFEDGSIITYLAKNADDEFSSRLYGVERASLFRVGSRSSEKSKRQDIYELVTAPIPLDDSVDAQTFNGDKPTLIHSVIQDGETTELTFYRVSSAQVWADMVNEEIGKYAKSLEK